MLMIHTIGDNQMLPTVFCKNIEKKTSYLDQQKALVLAEFSSQIPWQETLN